MSTSGLNLSSLGLNTTTGTSSAPITFAGLGSGLNTTSIVAALMAVQREPVTHLSEQQSKLQAGESALQSVQGSLQQLSFSVSEFSLPSLFESSQTVTSNEPTRVSAGASAGAPVGGYEVEVKQLANSAQRTFTFTSPAAEDTITIEGQEFKLKAGGTAKELADTINADSSAKVFAAALENGTIVLSTRATGATGAEFIKVTDPGGALKEKEGTAKEGRNAEFTVDGVAGTSSSNTVTTAIAGVTLTLSSLTPTGPVTIDVQPPGPSASAVEAQVQSFIKLYNTTVEAIQKQLTTKPPAHPQTSAELGAGTLFGDPELSSLLDSMRTTMYENVAGLEAGMSSPLDIGISTGAPTGGASTSQATLEGLLTLNSSKLTEAVKTNPAGVQKMLQGWSKTLTGLINQASQPGGGLEARINGDTAEITQLGSQITNMNEMLALREKALQATFTQLESVIAQNNAQATSLVNAFAADQPEQTSTSASKL